MKKILSLVIVLIAIGQVNANATEPHSPVGMSVLKNGPLVKVFYQGEETGKVKVTIYNDRGRIIFTETLKDKENFMRPYNFSHLPAGKYSIELIDGNSKRVKEITHDRQASGNVAVLTRLRQNGSKYMLAVPNEGRNALTVRIYDNYSNLVYAKSEIIHGDFATVYDLSKFKGNYTFEVADKNGNIVRLKK